MKTHISFFLFHCKVEKQLSPKALKAYEIDLHQFAIHIKFKDVNGLIKEDLKSYFTYLSKFSSSTMKRKIATLKAFFSHLEFKEIIDQNPFRKIRIKIKNDLILPKTMSLDELKKILIVAYKYKSKINDCASYSYKEAVRNIAVVELLFASGIRVSELSSLTMNNISDDFSLIKILGKGNKERIIPITNSATQDALIENYRLFEAEIKLSSFFFINRHGNPLSEQSIRYLVGHLAKQAKINKHITPHVFRHSFATILLEEGADIRYIQHLLGHSSITVTQIYTHVNEKKKKQLMTLKNPRNFVSI